MNEIIRIRLRGIISNYRWSFDAFFTPAGQINGHARCREATYFVPFEFNLDANRYKQFCIWIKFIQTLPETPPENSYLAVAIPKSPVQYIRTKRDNDSHDSPIRKVNNFIDTLVSKIEGLDETDEHTVA